MLLFSQGEDGVLQDGEAQLMMGRMLTLLQASYSNDSVVMYVCVLYSCVSMEYDFMRIYIGPDNVCEQNLGTCETYSAATGISTQPTGVCWSMCI